jgi:threonine/homoserine/homoserine lactone efflux protein
MDVLLALLSIVGAVTIGAISPGPSFVLVVRTAIARSRRDGLAAALGMGIGGVTFATLALLGLHAVLAQASWAAIGLKLLGATYLLYLAFGLWRGADAPLTVASPAALGGGGLARSFWIALATQLSNPKAMIVYGSVFAALLPPAVPLWADAVLLAAIFAIEAGWYTVVALAFSADRPRAAYGRAKRWLDRAAGLVMGALGARLTIESVRAP